MNKEIKAALKTTGRAISDARQLKGLSMEDLADQIGCHRKTIQNIEAGLGGRIQTYIQIKKILEVEIL